MKQVSSSTIKAVIGLHFSVVVEKEGAVTEKEINGDGTHGKLYGI